MNVPCFVVGLVALVLVVVIPTVKTGWKKGRVVLKSTLIGGISAGIALWLLAMLVLQTITRVEPNADFKQAVEITYVYIQGGIYLFAIVGGLAGGLFMTLWYEDPDEKTKKKSKSKT